MATREKMESRFVSPRLLVKMIDADVLCRESNDQGAKFRFEQKIIDTTEENSEKNMKKTRITSEEFLKINEVALETSKKAKDLMEEISKLSPNIKKASYLVLSNKYGQCNMIPDIDFILKEFPEAFCPKEKVQTLISILKEKNLLLKEGKSIETVNLKIEETSGEINFCQDVMVELRFVPGMLSYEMVSLIMSSSLISKNLTRSPLAPVLFNVSEVITTKE